MTRLFKAGVQPSQIGVITPYEGQRAYLANYMQYTGTLKRNLDDQIEIASVDAFQGPQRRLATLMQARSREGLHRALVCAQQRAPGHRLPGRSASSQCRFDSVRASSSALLTRQCQVRLGGHRQPCGLEQGARASYEGLH